MAKKHFNSLAEQLAAVRPAPFTGDKLSMDYLPYCDELGMWRDCVNAVARGCAKHNPAFNTARFIAACRGE